MSFELEIYRIWEVEFPLIDSGFVSFIILDIKEIGV